MAKEKKQAKRTKPGQKNSSFFNLPYVVMAVVLAILTYVTFSPSLLNEFTNWDDPTYVTENDMVQSRETNWKEIFSTPVSLNYHPITMLTLAWNYQAAMEKGNGKLNAQVFHTWNIWIHIFNTLLVFYFIWLLSGKQLLTAAFTAAIFGVHPLHVESVTWISERKDVMYTFFFLLSCISYLYYLDRKNILYLVLCFVLFVLSCLSKAVAVVLPVVLLAIDYFKARQWSWKWVLEKIPFLLLSLVIGYKAYTIQATDAIAKTEVFTLFQRVMFGSYGACMYIIKFFVPFKLSTFYPYPTTDKNGVIPVEYYIAPLIWVALGALVFISLRKNKFLSFGVAFFIITIALVLQFLSVGSAIMADRYSYVPYIGIAFILGSLGEIIIKKYKSAAIAVYIACAGFIIALSIQAHAQSKIWKNSSTLWTQVIVNYPDVEVAYKNRGNYYGKEKGNVDSSYADYMVLKKMNSKDTKVYSNMGNVYGMRKQTDSAIWCYNRALDLDKNNDEAYVNRGITFSMLREYDKAIADYNHAEEITGPTQGVLQNRAYTYFAMGKYRESLNDYNKLVAVRPDDGSAYYFRAIDNEQLNNFQQAWQDLQSAIANGYKVDDATRQRIQGKAGK